jgi:tRNA G10  N-methylase Trm11
MVNEKVVPGLKTGKILIYAADTALAQINTLLVTGFGKRVQSEIRNAERQTLAISDLSLSAVKSGKGFEPVFTDLKSGSAKAARETAKLSETIASAEESSRKINEMNFESKLGAIYTQVAALKKSLGEIKQNTNLTDGKEVASLKQTIDTINSKARRMQMHVK